MSRRRTAVYGNERKLFFAALTLFFAGCALYVYFVSASIVHAIVRKEVTQEIAALSSRVSDLETDYIEAKHGLDESVVSAYGFRPITERIFVERAPTNLVLSQNDEG